MLTAIENNPIVTSLVTAVNDTGWSMSGNQSIHVVCNSGYINLLNYPITPGHTYLLTYTIVSISSGYVQSFVGNTGGTHYTTPQIVQDTLVSSNSDPVRIYSNANCTIEYFNIKDITIVDGVTLVYSMLNKKWSHFWSAMPDFGVSLFESNITMYQGGMWFQLNGSDNTNNWYGVQYQSIVKAVFAKNPGIIHTFDVLSYQANQLLVSTQGGITTPLGQQTTLIQSDFIKAKLDDGTLTSTVYQYDNVYSASFWNDDNDDPVNGSPMRGNYIIVELQTVDGSSLLKLFSESVKQSRAFIGNR